MFKGGSGCNLLDTGGILREISILNKCISIQKKKEEEETKTLEESHILEISSESHKVKQPH